MQFVGIVKEHERGIIKIGKPLEEYYPPGIQKLEDHPKIISYLERGTISLAFLHCVTDAHNNPLVPLIFYTDGKWIWPSYVAYYLTLNKAFLLPEEFVTDIKGYNFEPPEITPTQRLNAERYYLEVYDPNHRSLRKPPA